jgi:hypothetical protein
MSDSVFSLIQLAAGFFLIFFLLSEDFQQGLKRLQTFLQARPRWRYVAYPLGVLLVLGAAALIVQALVIFAASRFSYD